MTSVKGKSLFFFGINVLHFWYSFVQDWRKDGIQTRYCAVIKCWSQVKIWILVLKMTLKVFIFSNVLFWIDLSSTEVIVLRGKWITFFWNTYHRMWAHYYGFMVVLLLSNFSCFRHWHTEVTVCTENIPVPPTPFF